MMKVHKDNPSEINTISPEKETLIKTSDEIDKESKPKPKLSYKLSKSEQLKNLIFEILSKDSNSRNSQELLIVGDYLLKNYDYFKNLKNNSTQIKMEKIAKICKLEKFKPNETIIVYGDIGNKFYIVLEGQVGVFLPEYYEKELTPFEYFKLLEKIKRVDKFKYERLKSKNNQISFDNINMNVLYNSKFMKNKIKLFLEKNDKKGEYGEGFTFGDIALLKQSTRNATVKSLINTTCISIDKSDYIGAIKEIESKKLLKDIDLFKKKYQFFNCFNNERMIKIFNCFSKIELYKGDYLFHQNDINDNIYIVIRGNFEVYSYISYSWLNEYYHYIDDSLGNILFYMISNPNLRFDEFQDLVENIKLNITKSPMKNINYSICNDINISNKNNSKDNLYYIKCDEEQMNNNKNIFKIDINKVNYNDIFGLEDCFDFKRKFYTVKCISESAELKSIKINDLLRIIWNSKKSDYLYILRLIMNKKNILKNKIINSVKSLEKKIMSGFDTRYENLIENNIYNKKEDIPNDLKLNNKIKNNKQKEQEKNRIISAIKLKGYNTSIQDILDKNIKILPQEKSLNDKKNFQIKKSMNYQLLKNLFKKNNNNPHIFKFNKKLYKSLYYSESKNDSIISNFSPTSKKLTNYTTYNNVIKKNRNIIEFSGLNIDKQEKDDISYNNTNRLNKTNNIERSLSSMNKYKKTNNFFSFYSGRKNKKINLNKNIKRKSKELKFSSFIIPKFTPKSNTYITSAKHNFNFIRKSISFGLNNNIEMMKPYMSPQTKLENKRKDIFSAVKKVKFIKKSMDNKTILKKYEDYFK